MMISHRSDLIAVVIEDVQSSIRAHAKEFAIQLPANRERLRAFWRMLYESRRTRAFTHSRMARARFNADPWPSTFDESIPPDAVVGVTRQGPIGRSSASFLRCPAEVRLGSIAPLANPSANDRYLRIPAEDWSRRKDKARSVGRTCRHAVMANCRIAQARKGHLSESPDCVDSNPRRPRVVRGKDRETDGAVRCRIRCTPIRGRRPAQRAARAQRATSGGLRRCR